MTTIIGLFTFIGVWTPRILSNQHLEGEEMVVNPTKGKQLTNIRASGSDDAISLTPHRPLSIEIGLEIMQEDEYLEVCPKSVRLRKQHLKESARVKNKR